MQIVHRRHAMRIGVFGWRHRIAAVGFAAMIAAGCASAQVPPSLPAPPPPASAPAPVASSRAYAWPLTAVERARAVVDTLASDDFFGRGYGGFVFDAADWVSTRIRAMPGVSRIGRGDLYGFSFLAHVVEQAGVEVDGRRLTLGVDVLPFLEPREGRASGSPCAPEAARPGCVLVMEDGEDVRSSIVEAARRGAAGAVVLVDALPPYGQTVGALPIPSVLVRRGAWSQAAQTARMQIVAWSGKVKGDNVVAAVRGSAVPDSFVVVTAHLDHWGRIGDPFGGPPAVFRGANDNGSGVAAALALADTLARRPLRYTTVIALTGGEEHGLHGSTALVRNPLWPLDRTRLVVNLDMVASGETGIGVFGAAEQPEMFAAMQGIAARQALGPLTGRAMRANSDQYPFFEAGVPALYLLTLGGRQPYHSVADVPETLEWDDWARVVALAHGTLRHVTGGD